ncbi:MAG: succinyl-CoA--3-ketoacid-CoA transferase [Eubacterium sp.]|nr:succinyl-CoA--3-ketoacid-CoA transferase [Eubacterium sp.]
MDPREFIARKAASLLPDGAVVNLGVGIPTMASDFIHDGIWIQSENGIIGVGRHAEPGVRKVESYCNASGEEIIPVKGACTFDVNMALGMLRAGQIDATVLGCFEVAENGDLANWTMPGKSPGMGGAMDIVCGTENVIVATRHCSKNGKSKIVKRFTYPLTGAGVVKTIITEYCLFSIVDEHLVLMEIRDGITVDELREITDADFTVSPDLKPMEVEV